MRTSHPKLVGLSLVLAVLAVTTRASAADRYQLSDRSSSDGVMACEDGSCEIPCNMCPCDYIVLEGLMMQRTNSSGDIPLVLNINSGATLLSTRDLDFDLGAGFRVYGGHRLNDCWGIELGYFGLMGQTANATVVQAEEILIPGDLGLTVNNFNSADQVDVEYTSQIQGAEANLVSCCCSCDCDKRCRSIEWLYGFRYLSLTERFSLTSIDAAESTSTYRIHTQNNLYGAQIGSRLRRCYGRFSVEGTGKAGLFCNDANQAQDPIIDFPATVIRDRVASSAQQVAFVGELNLTGIYHINNVWGLRAGYNLLWVEGVALAADQLDFTNTPTSGLAIDTQGGVFMHGLSAGIEARW